VGREEDAYSSEFLVKKPSFIAGHFKNEVAIKVRIRYNHKESLAKITPFNNKIKVRFQKPQFAITPGQSAVFYKGDNVLGGGIIEKVLD